MKKYILITLLFSVFLVVISCDHLNITTLTIDGAVMYQETSSRLEGGYGVFIVAKANLDFYDRNAIPSLQPSYPDSSSDFQQIELPSFLTPEKGAEVRANNTSLNEAFDGQYQGSLSIQPGDSVELFVATQTGDTGKANMVVPSHFDLFLNDTTFSHDSISSLNIVWSHSEHSNAYMLMLYSMDTTNNQVSLKLKTTTEDTTYEIPKDSLTPGVYAIQVSAVYGKLNAQMPQAGTLVGVLGQVAALYAKKPVIINIK